MSKKTSGAFTNNGKGHPRIGNYIHYHILQNYIKKADVASALGVSPAGFTAHLKRDSWQFELLWKACHCCKFNFLAHLAEYMPYPYETKAEKQLREELAQKDELIKRMEIQLETLREVRKK